MSEFWRKCSTCGNPIAFQSAYHKCSVSTCRKSAYCSVDCWEIHLGLLNHKEAWAEEERAPSKEAAQAEGSGRRRIVVSSKPKASSTQDSGDIPHDILIVVSKLKAYVKARFDMNTSADVMEELSDIVRDKVSDACMKARRDGRKTVMKRDF